MLDRLGRQVGDFGNVSDSLLLSVTRWSEVLHYSMPMMAKVLTKVKKDEVLTFCTQIINVVNILQHKWGDKAQCDVICKKRSHQASLGFT